MTEAGSRLEPTQFVRLCLAGRHRPSVLVAQGCDPGMQSLQISVCIRLELALALPPFLEDRVDAPGSTAVHLTPAWTTDSYKWPGPIQDHVRPDDGALQLRGGPRG